ncbi:MAG: 2-dehydro-3-deoxyphosphogluconate aldolase / (4S)-4-hydroxy-2-oxoglutarate aldolase [Chloroflexota bacterium]|jgi:2-dehydro-3-deoxyphosphogluconate aldolase/(4S)-4-hydroxy-2-oxoglutarate aldolase|nr:2-dehydro-3-deoxyphosphogluconate aldolase / (4S)-4-hydroxy-2-oxoglutarate aldolase [Chloroflexota bacterium]
MPGDLVDVLSVVGIVPVISLARAEDAVAVARALLDGGLRCIEITFRTAAAAEALRRVRGEVPEMTLLAGTVLSLEQVAAAVAAGADGIVTPGFNIPVVERSRELGIAIVPGIATPTELELALRHDLGLVKLFPAEPIGGVPYLKALAGPYPDVRFVPTGGIGPRDLASYLALPNVAAVGGSWLAPRDAVASGDYERIRALASEAAAIVRDVRGVSAASPEPPGRATSAKPE